MEILSPVGDINNFYTAIRSGANAVYFGLPKFNARIKAENIDLDNLPKLVDYAHLKNVKVYITLNTIVSDAEMSEVVDLVGRCLEARVDAFIVQDMGIISVLKSLYPDIELHGSTQLGIHNIRGAKVAKSIGLSRIVLSRETTIEDIESIRKNVDIEIEVFVQGALCVAFSGNCYMSSLKHNASGNRGECKQLCRLPFALSNGKKTINGYCLSPSDICMIEYLEKLKNIGVSSLKIEGRLRHSGYVAVATSIYREAVDSICNGTKFDYVNAKKNLAKVFARGEYIAGYNETNDIISIDKNNHMGEVVGKVIACQKFKDIYRISMKLNTPIHTGDGLKIVSKNTITMGVGNIEYNGNNTVVYGKNKVDIGSIVYRPLDSEFEKSVVDNSLINVIDFDIKCEIGRPLEITASTKGVFITLSGDVCSEAISKPITRDNILDSINRFDREIFSLGKVNINLSDNCFVPLKSINELRRQVLEKLTDRLTDRKIVTRIGDMPKELKPIMEYDRIAIINENMSIADYKDYKALILSPTKYNLNVIERFVTQVSKYSIQPIINLPIIMRIGDTKIIDSIVEKYTNKCIFIANNIYSIDYIKLGARVWAGSGLNIANTYSASKYLELGCESIISSIEKWYGKLKIGYKITSGNMVLMTMAHCPNKTMSHCDCSKCSHSGDMILSGTPGQFRIRRYTVGSCYFELVDDRTVVADALYKIEDKRI